MSFFLGRDALFALRGEDGAGAIIARREVVGFYLLPAGRRVGVGAGAAGWFRDINLYVP